MDNTVLNSIVLIYPVVPSIWALAFLKIVRDSLFKKDKNFVRKFPVRYSAIFAITVISIIIYSFIEVLIVTVGMQQSTEFNYLYLIAIVSTLSIGLIDAGIEKDLAKGAK